MIQELGLGHPSWNEPVLHYELPRDTSAFAYITWLLLAPVSLSGFQYQSIQEDCGSYQALPHLCAISNLPGTEKEDVNGSTGLWWEGTPTRDIRCNPRHVCTPTMFTWGLLPDKNE